jgi:cysteine desulfurase
MGVSDEMINGSVRFSLVRSTTKEDLDFLVEKLVKIVGNLRKISPIVNYK